MAAATFSQNRCLNHPQREAVARCPECREFFCRECVAEHDDRVICSSCLRKLAARKERPKRSFSVLLRPIALLGGLLVAWLYFYLIGNWSSALPSKFHEGTIWNSSSFDEAE